MIELVRKIGYFFINLQYSFAFLVILLIRRKKVRIPRCNGKDVFLLMNGPSLARNLQDYKDILSKKKCMCVNMMAKSEEYELLKPHYYTIADVKFWEQMKGSDDNEFLRNEQKNWDELSDYIVEKTHWKMYLFLPDLARSNVELVNKLNSNKNIHIVFLNSGILFKGFDGVLFKVWKKQLCLPDLINVLVLAIYVSVLMGFENIYLLGCDHSYFSNFHVDENNKFYYEYHHSYDSRNAFKVPYDSYGKEYSMSRILSENATLWETYEKLDKFSRINLSHIYNCTSVSMIDVFKRKKLSEVLNEAQ